MSVEARRKLAEQIEMIQLMLDDTVKVLEGLCEVQAGTIDPNDETFWVELDRTIARIEEVCAGVAYRRDGCGRFM
jgi:hypothetical protein